MSTTTISRIKQMSPQLVVANLEHTLAFYIQQLGFDVDFRHEDFYAGIIKDGFSIHLKLGKPSPEERERKRNNEDLDISFSVEGIEALYQELSTKSVLITQPLREMPYGKEFYITDPDGYIIGFLEGTV